MLRIRILLVALVVINAIFLIFNLMLIVMQNAHAINIVATIFNAGATILGIAMLSDIKEKGDSYENGAREVTYELLSKSKDSDPKPVLNFRSTEGKYSFSVLETKDNEIIEVSVEKQFAKIFLLQEPEDEAYAVGYTGRFRKIESDTNNRLDDEGHRYYEIFIRRSMLL